MSSNSSLSVPTPTPRITRPSLTLSKDEHPGGQADLPGARRHVTKGGERVPVAGASPDQLSLRHTDMLAASEVVVAEAIRRLRDAGELLNGGILLPFTAGTGAHGHNRRRHR
jgi:hypothetical protein